MTYTKKLFLFHQYQQIEIEKLTACRFCDKIKILSNYDKNNFRVYENDSFMEILKKLCTEITNFEFISSFN